MYGPLLDPPGFLRLVPGPGRRPGRPGHGHLQGALEPHLLVPGQVLPPGVLERLHRLAVPLLEPTPLDGVVPLGRSQRAPGRLEGVPGAGHGFPGPVEPDEHRAPGLLRVPGRRRPRHIVPRRLLHPQATDPGGALLDVSTKRPFLFVHARQFPGLGVQRRPGRPGPGQQVGQAGPGRRLHGLHVAEFGQHGPHVGRLPLQRSGPEFGGQVLDLAPDAGQGRHRRLDLALEGRAVAAVALPVRFEALGPRLVIPGPVPGRPGLFQERVRPG